MGLFNSILKNLAQDAFNGAKQSGITGNVNNTQNYMHNETAPKTESGKPDLMSTANNPPKPSREVKETLYDGEDGNTVVTYSFMLSGDFAESYSNAGEIDWLGVYNPFCEGEFCEYNIGDSAFIVSSAPENEVYDLIEKYKHSGTPEGIYSFERVSDMGSKVYFKACTLVRGVVLYFYAIDRGISCTNNYIGIMYDKELFGTPLERKLMSEVDEAVRSYKESI